MRLTSESSCLVCQTDRIDQGLTELRGCRLQQSILTGATCGPVTCSPAVGSLSVHCANRCISAVHHLSSVSRGSVFRIQPSTTTQSLLLHHATEPLWKLMRKIMKAMLEFREHCLSAHIDPPHATSHISSFQPSLKALDTHKYQAVASKHGTDKDYELQRML